VNLPQTATAKDVTNTVLYPPGSNTASGGAAPSISAVMMGLTWDGQGGAGQEIIWNGSDEGTPCQTYSYGQPNLWNVSGSNWNDRIRSAEAYADCLHNKFFENTSYGGSVLDCHQTSCTNSMGIMDQQASSITWNWYP
jgi:hypothetical protein